MADTSVLEREYVSVDEAEREHKELISDNYQRYFGDREEREQNDYNAAPMNSYAAPAYKETVGYYGSSAAQKYKPSESRYPAEERRASASQSQIPSAAQRLADYVPITVGMTKLQRIGDMPSYQASGVVNYAPVVEPEVKEEEPAPARPQLFDGLLYRDGELINSYAPVADPVEQPSYMPEPVVAPEYDPSYMPAEEDALPTRRTMESIRPVQQTREGENVGFFASLSAKTKLALAVVATVLVLMIALVCINTAIINSLNADIEYREAVISQLVETSNGIQTEIAEITDPSNIASWAQEHGMTLEK